MHYGFPEKKMRDQGHNFESKLIAELYKLSKIKNCKPCHTGHSVMGNGNISIQPFNILMIATLPTEAKIRWQEHWYKPIILIIQM